MVKEKLFLSLKHQYCVSQYGEHDYGANRTKNGDYYENPSLTFFTDELRL